MSQMSSGFEGNKEAHTRASYTNIRTRTLTISRAVTQTNTNTHWESHKGQWNLMDLWFHWFEAASLSQWVVNILAKGLAEPDIDADKRCDLTALNSGI